MTLMLLAVALLANASAWAAETALGRWPWRLPLWLLILPVAAAFSPLPMWVSDLPADRWQRLASDSGAMTWLGLLLLWESSFYLAMAWQRQSRYPWLLPWPAPSVLLLMMFGMHQAMVFGPRWSLVSLGVLGVLLPVAGLILLWWLARQLLARHPTVLLTFCLGLRLLALLLVAVLFTATQQRVVPPLMSDNHLPAMLLVALGSVVLIGLGYRRQRRKACE